MSAISRGDAPRLAPGHRLGNAASQPDVLLVPEGALRLKGPARMILESCDGCRTVEHIVVALSAKFPGESPARIESEVMALLTGLHDRGAIEIA